MNKCVIGLSGFIISVASIIGVACDAGVMPTLIGCFVASLVTMYAGLEEVDSES